MMMKMMMMSSVEEDEPEMEGGGFWEFPWRLNLETLES